MDKIKFLIVMTSSIFLLSTVNTIFAAPLLPEPKLDNTIDILSIQIGAASPQNSANVLVSFRVRNLVNPGICGLTASNFNLITYKVPPFGHAVDITKFNQLEASQAPHVCYYRIGIAPKSYQDTQYPWIRGTYTVNLIYNQGALTALRAFNFTV
jgi:hypothetical protein